jgi:hypothetical protein
MATRTAWAQTSQSIPKTVSSARRISACANVAESNIPSKNAKDILFINLL